MAANTILQLTFKRSDLKTTTMAITDPKSGLTVDAVNTAMAGIIAKNIFAPDRLDLIAKVKAELVVTDYHHLFHELGRALTGRVIPAPTNHHQHKF